MYKETILKKAVVVAGVILSMSGTLLAGGTKMVNPVDAKVVPIPEVISPIPLYVGVGLVASFIKRDPCPCDPNGSDLKDLRYGTFIRGGYDFNNYFGIEGRAFKTLGSDTFSEVTHYGLYAKPQYHLIDALNIYGLIGYGKTIVDYTNGIQSSHNTKNAFSYGVGIEYDLSKDEILGEFARGFDGQGDQEKGWGLWIDMQHLLSNSGSMNTNSNIVAGGITYDF